MKTVLILVPLAAVLVVALVIRLKAAQVAFNFLTADETDEVTRLDLPPAPVEDWDTYAVTYRHPARFHPLTEWFAAESPEAATAAALEGNPGATVIEVLNLSGNGEYERGAR